MNKEMPTFKISEAKGKEQKLIVELLGNLVDVTKAFVKLNINTTKDNEMFVVIRDATITNLFIQLASLVSMMSEKKQIPLFLEECRDIFNAYLNRIIK